MIKKLLLAIMIAFPMSLFAQKFGVINTTELIESLPEVKTVNAPCLSFGPPVCCNISPLGRIIFLRSQQ